MNLALILLIGLGVWVVLIAVAGALCRAAQAGDQSDVIRQTAAMEDAESLSPPDRDQPRIAIARFRTRTRRRDPLGPADGRPASPAPPPQPDDGAAPRRAARSRRGSRF